MNSFLYSNDIEYIIGILFGLEETAAAICRIDSNYCPDNIDITGIGMQAIPSTVYIETNDDGTEDIYIGKDAIGKYGKGGKGVFFERFMVLTKTIDERENPSIVAMRLFMSEVYKTICHLRAGELMDGDRIKKNHFVFVASPSQMQGMDNHMLYYYTKIAIDAGLPIAEFDLDLATIDIKQILPSLNNLTKPNLLIKSVFPLQNAIDTNRYSLVGIVSKSVASLCEKEALKLPLVIIDYNYESSTVALIFNLLK